MDLISADYDEKNDEPRYQFEAKLQEDLTKYS